MGGISGIPALNQGRRKCRWYGWQRWRWRKRRCSHRGKERQRVGMYCLRAFDRSFILVVCRLGIRGNPRKLVRRIWAVR